MMSITETRSTGNPWFAVCADEPVALRRPSDDVAWIES